MRLSAQGQTILTLRDWSKPYLSNRTKPNKKPIEPNRTPIVRLGSAIEQNRTPNLLWVRFSNQSNQYNRTKSNKIEQIQCNCLLTPQTVKRGTWGFAVLRCWRFFNAVMRWIKSQLAVLRWSQTTRCAMFVFFTLRWSVKWNCLRCWSFFIYLSRT